MPTFTNWFRNYLSLSIPFQRRSICACLNWNTSAMHDTETLLESVLGPQQGDMRQVFRHQAQLVLQVVPWQSVHNCNQDSIQLDWSLPHLVSLSLLYSSSFSFAYCILSLWAGICCPFERLRCRRLIIMHQLRRLPMKYSGNNPRPQSLPFLIYELWRKGWINFKAVLIKMITAKIRVIGCFPLSSSSLNLFFPLSP